MNRIIQTAALAAALIALAAGAAEARKVGICIGRGGGSFAKDVQGPAETPDALKAVCAKVNGKITTENGRLVCTWPEPTCKTDAPSMPAPAPAPTPKPASH